MFIVGPPGAGKTSVANKWIECVEASQGCRMAAHCVNQLPWLEGVFQGRKVVFVGRWVSHHGKVGGSTSTLDSRGLRDATSGQGADRIPPGIGTHSFAMWLPQWADAGVEIVVVDSILPRVLSRSPSKLVEAANDAGYKIKLLELTTSEFDCAMRVRAREEHACSGMPSEMLRAAQVVQKHTKHWLAATNPWRKPPWEAPVSPEYNRVVTYEYVTCSTEVACTAFSSEATALPMLWCFPCTSDDDPRALPMREEGNGSNTTQAEMLYTNHQATPEEIPTLGGLFYQELCPHCSAPVSTHQLDNGLKHKVRMVTCAGCDRKWHFECYYGDSQTGAWRILCDTCEYYAEVGMIRPPNCLKVGQVFAGLGTGMMQLCELASEGLDLKPLRNVYSLEWEPSAIMYVLQLGNQAAYSGMTPITIQTDFLSDSCVVDDFPHVHVLFLTLVCAKFSQLHNGHDDVQLDMDDPDTRRITLKCCRLLRRHKPAATFIVMENVLGWVRSRSFACVMDAARQGGYRVLVQWECRANEELGVPEHRDRLVMLLGHKTHAGAPDEGIQYALALQECIQRERDDSQLELAHVFLDHQKGTSTELTLVDCGIGPAEVTKMTMLTPSEAHKVRECKKEILLRAQRGVGEASVQSDGSIKCASWYTGDMLHSGGAGFPNLHKTIGRLPTVIASHGYRGVYSFHHSRERFFLVPELMVARGFSALPIMAACNQFGDSELGWRTLGWLVGGAAPPSAYRVILNVLYQMAPHVMKRGASFPTGQLTLPSAFSHGDLETFSMVQRFKWTYLVYPGAEAWVMRDFNRTPSVRTDDWQHIYVKDFKQPYTQVHVPG